MKGKFLIKKTDLTKIHSHTYGNIFNRKKSIKGVITLEIKSIDDVSEFFNNGELDKIKLSNYISSKIHDSTFIL